MKSALHHLTALCSSAQKNYDFYTGALGLRFVKKTVNFDSPDTYHLYYGNEEGEPGTILTFFPFPNAGTGMRGAGQATKIQLAVPPASLSFWIERFHKFNVKYQPITKSFGNSIIRFFDPDGLQLELVMTEINQDIQPWTADISAEFAIRGMFGIELSVQKADELTKLMEKLDYSLLAEEENTLRYKHNSASAANFIDILKMPGWPIGKSGAGTIHHLAFQVRDEAHQLEVREAVAALGLTPTPIVDRNYFKSVYFREPNNILFELATTEPGFAIDENLAELGSELKLPQQYESQRELITNLLPELHTGKHKYEEENDDVVTDLNLYHHLFIKNGPKTIILFHGTGGDEKSLLGLANRIDSQASILALRGNIVEQGITRFFARPVNGTFDIVDIDKQVKNFNKFWQAAIEKYQIDVKQTIFLGYSNGANFITANLWQHPELIGDAILLHPVLIDQLAKPTSLKGKKLYVTGGETDESLRNPDEIKELTEQLSDAGAEVELKIYPGGHAATTTEIDEMIEWVKQNL